ncbi:MAG: hydroxyquinol 1,2-dioxygenase [Alphaproteobacteria bacterium]|nr:hydroxyquinol 1,2-dioxygenase [Alphaproteobacteria bacterium]
MSLDRAKPTIFGALNDFQKGGIDIVDDDPKNYVFSNIFEVASTSEPYERVAVAKNFEYVIEAARAEGSSDWYAAAHDEFVLCMDGEIRVDLIKLADDASYVAPDSEGGHKLKEQPNGQKMGHLVLRRGHMGMLPVGAAYSFSASKPSAMMIQTIQGPETVHKWAEVCLS